MAETHKPELFELNNGTMAVKISNFGATITSLSVSDKDGKLADVVLGFDSLEPYLCNLGCLHNGVEYSLPINKPANSLHENEGFDQSYDFSSRINGVVNGYCEDSNGIHHEEGRLIGAKAKRLLPLFDEIGMETENGIIHEGQEGSESGALLNFSISKWELENKKLAIEEEVHHVYERLQALEADREFLKHCINSLKKGDKGLDLLQEILQHLCDLRSVELRVRNMSDGAPS